MKHPTRETLIQYIHWELPEREQRILDTHLAQCSSCAELYAQLVEAELPAPRVPQDFTERVMAQVRLTPLRKERSFAARYVAAAAIALVLWQTGLFGALIELPKAVADYSYSMVLKAEENRVERQEKRWVQANTPRPSLSDRISAIYNSLFSNTKKDG